MGVKIWSNLRNYRFAEKFLQKNATSSSIREVTKVSGPSAAINAIQRSDKKLILKDTCQKKATALKTI
jgi:hypothetical protein